VTSKKPWLKFMESLPFVEDPPGPQWLSPIVYSSRAETVPQAVRRAVEKGTIKREHCLATGNKIRAGYKLLINWNETAYNYIRTRHKRSWPADFDIDSGEYRPIPVGKSKKKITKKKVTKKKTVNLTELDLIDNIQDAKLAMEKLKIAERQRDYDIADNKLIPIESVVEICVSLAHAIKSQLMRFIVLASSDLLACTEINEVRKTCERYFKDVLSEVESIIKIKDHIEKNNE